MPRKRSEFAAGYDLYNAEEMIIQGRGNSLVRTGIAFAVPNGSYGRIAPIFELALKHSIDSGGGVVDSDYRGEIFVLLINHEDTDFKGND